MSPAATPVRVFISYAHEDRDWCDQLVAHLGALAQTGRIARFDDSEIVPGEWERQLRAQLDAADIIVLIVTRDFGNSPFCTGVELKRALERFKTDGAPVVPILAEHCDWEALPIGNFQMLPQDEQRNLKPLRKWRDPSAPRIASSCVRQGHLAESNGDSAQAPSPIGTLARVRRHWRMMDVSHLSMTGCSQISTAASGESRAARKTEPTSADP